MELRIDTSKDSKDDIKKAIRLLQSLVDEQPDSADSNSFPSGENVLGGFFDADTPTPSQPSSPDQTTQVSVIPESEVGAEAKKETKSRKFSIGSAGGFDVY